MTFWIVLACVLLLLWLISRIRIGAAAAYSEAGFTLVVKAGPKRISIIPSRGTKRKKKPAKEAQAGEKAQKPKRSARDTLSIAQEVLPLIAEAAGKFKQKIRIDRLNLHIIWAASDPAAAAQGYGFGNAAMGMLWALIDHNFNVKEHDLRVDVDFERTKPELNADAQVTITIGQCFDLSLRLGIKALKIYLGLRRGKTDKSLNEKAVQA